MKNDFVRMVAAAADVKELGRIGKVALGGIFSDLAAIGMSGRMAAGVFMATVLAVYCYIADASFVPGDDVDAEVWEVFRARVDRCAARSAAARLRWERRRAMCAEDDGAAEAAEMADAEVVVPEEVYEDVVGKVAEGLPYLDESKWVDCRCMSVEVIAYDWFYERGFRDGRLMRAVEGFIEEVARRYRVRMGW
ncbi:MAG: hypothetical protein K2I24_03015 [Duncaniella sp.]|nr:hypothetical protein [Duncaniella sp.]